MSSTKFNENIKIKAYFSDDTSLSNTHLVSIFFALVMGHTTDVFQIKSIRQFVVFFSSGCSYEFKA